MSRFESHAEHSEPHISDAPSAFHSELFEAPSVSRAAYTSDSTMPSMTPMEQYSALSAPPEGVDPAAWSQVSQMIGAGYDVNFSSGDEENAPIPDFIMNADGTLTANPDKTTPNPDGSVTIQMDPNLGADAAKQAAQQLQVAAVQEKIAYWQAANPGSTDIPEYLKGMLADAQTRAAEPPPAPRPEPYRPAPPAGMPSSRSGRSSYGDGVPQQVGHSSIGGAPRSGYRSGSFEPNGPMDRTAIPPPVPGDLNIKGPPSCTVDQIQTFLSKMGSPAAKEQGFSQALYDACTQRGIDPAVAVGFFLQESTCGRYGRAHENMSLGNIKGSAPESGGSDGTFRRYGSWAEGARDWARLIDESYVQKRGLQTLSQVISVYAPGSDHNNERGYVATVKGVVEGFKRQNAANA